MEEKYDVSKSPKNKTMLFIVVLAIVFSLLTVFSIYKYLTPQRVTVWLFNNDYKAGTALTDDMLYAVQVDSHILVAGASSDTNSQFVTGSNKTAIVNSGDSLRIDVSAGMPLVKGLLSVNGGTAVEMSMDPSKVCITVPCNSVTGISDELTKGSRVNIYSTGFSESGANTTTLIFQNMKVANTAIKDGSIASITLEMTVEDSIKLVNYQNSSSLYFGLVDTTGYQYVEDNVNYSSTVQSKRVE